MTYRRF